MTRQETLAEFLRTWPLERIRSMTLEEYTKAGSKDSYTYWLEGRTDNLGSIWGGSAFKFGIYNRKDQKEQVNRRGWCFDAEYAWQERHGATPEEAYARIHSLILQAIEAIQFGDLRRIDAVDLPNVLKWKSAFLFQDFEKPLIPMIFKDQAIWWLAAQRGVETKLFPDCMERLGRDWQPGTDWFEYSMDLWREWEKEVPLGLAVADTMGWWVEDLQKEMAGERSGVFWWSKNTSGGAEVLKALRKSIDEVGSFPFLVCRGKNVAWEFEIEDVSTADEYPSKDWSAAAWHQPSFDLYRDDKKSARLAFLVRNINRVEDMPVSGIRWWKDFRAPTQDNLQPFSEWNRSASEPLMDSVPKESKVMEPTNRILYGPPGTGKTYETRVAALTLLGEPISDDRKDVIHRYDALAEAGQIRFVTFHPSLAYEDFVEGLRPKLDGADAGNLSYVIRDGIFKAVCKDARRNWTAWQSKGLKRSFAELWSEVEAELESGSGSLVIPTPGRRTQFNVYEIDNEVIRFRKTNGNDNHTLNARTLEAIFEGTREVPGGLSTYYTGLSDWLKARAQGKIVAPSAYLKQYVLIIDEINRGNIPAIFGELITLLEPSKRMGQSEPLEVFLPSSQERFQVPPNLHVLGTMNTADRSVEALDVALRRRFDFVEMMPKPSLLGVVDEVDLAQMLQTINARLEALVDRDHTIGHAFFMGVTSLEDLKSVFQNKVLPLLQEFFYGDWNRIGLVLGAAFVTHKNVSGTTLFAKGFEHETDLPDRFALTPADSWDAKAFRSIYEA